MLSPLALFFWYVWLSLTVYWPLFLDFFFFRKKKKLRKNFKPRMKVFYSNKNLHLAVVLPFWDCLKQTSRLRRKKFKAWGFLAYSNSVDKAANPRFKAGLPLVHPYPKGKALWSLSLFQWKSLLDCTPCAGHGLWFQFPLWCEIIKKQI